MWNVNLSATVGNQCIVTRESRVLTGIRKAQNLIYFCVLLAHLLSQNKLHRTRMYYVGIVWALAAFYKRRLSEIDLSFEQYKKYILVFWILARDDNKRPDKLLCSRRRGTSLWNYGTKVISNSFLSTKKKKKKNISSICCLHATYDTIVKVLELPRIWSTQINIRNPFRFLNFPTFRSKTAYIKLLNVVAESFNISPILSSNKKEGLSFFTNITSALS